MRIAIAALCDDARIREDGRMDLIGVAPDRIGIPGLPWEGVLTFAVVLELSPDDDRATTGLNVVVVRVSDGATVGEVDPGSAKQSREVPSEVDGPVHLPFKLGLRTRFTEAGNHRVLVRGATGDVLGDVAIDVQPQG